MKKITTLILLLTALTGCTIAWGASYNMVGFGPDMVQYEYEQVSVNEEGMHMAAQAYCEAYGKYAALESTHKGGYEYINTYRCISPVAEPVTVYDNIERF